MSRGSVLVVDDEPDVREVLCEFLSHRGYDVVDAENGQAALKILETLRPDVVLMDVAMPVMDGMETLGRIIDAHPSVPVVMLTAYAGVATATRAL